MLNGKLNSMVISAIINPPHDPEPTQDPEKPSLPEDPNSPITPPESPSPTVPPPGGPKEPNPSR